MVEIQKFSYENTKRLTEDGVWSRDIRPLLEGLPRGVLDLWLYGFSEMMNNAIEHSSGSRIDVSVDRDLSNTTLCIQDNGEGIFKKIQVALDLEDIRHSVLELAKGKFTTDPDNHSGQGIFFTSRMFDEFSILSGGLYFSHDFGKEDWILRCDQSVEGTLVVLKLDNQTSRTPKQVFDQFSSGEDYSFSKTIVPVRLAQYTDDFLVSRSQARRLLVGLERFKVIVFDFTNVEAIGQAFADEVFRVFRNQHPDLEVYAVNQSSEVDKMIRRATAP